METNLERVKAFFSDSNWYLQKRRYNITLRAETIQEFLKQAQFQSILDIGCGDGSLSLPLLTPHRRLTLLDMSGKMLSIARSSVPAELRRNVDVVNEEFMAARLDQHAYDLILCVGVLAFVQSLGDFIDRIISLLKPGGSLIIENSDANHFYTSFARTYNWLRTLFGVEVCPTNTYSRKMLLELLRGRGFVLSGLYRYSLAFPLIQRTLSQEELYKMIRRRYGTAGRNRNAWMGNECLYCFIESSAGFTK